MRVFLTGATGFVGSHLLRALLEAGVPTAALVRRASDAGRIAGLRDRYVEIAGDLDASAELAGPLERFAPDTVVHLAWEGVAGRSRDAAFQIERNLPRCEDLVRLAAGVGARNWIGVGSQAEYGPCDAAIDEDRPTRPTTRYGAAKLAAGRAAARLCGELGMRFAWLRLFSAYGPMDGPDWLIPFVIRSLLAGESPPLTAGRQLWDYLYVTDAAAALRDVAASADAAGVFNLGSGEPRSVRSIAEAIRDRVAPGRELHFGEVAYRDDQVLHLEADTRRLRQTVGWRPRVSFDSGIEQTIEWFREHRGPPARSRGDEGGG